jgi:tRNA threonylcarbamoyladenosine biosynthesis protein TsaB
MILLATDTSGKHGSIALAREETGRVEVLEVVPLEGGTFSAQLVPQIAALLTKHRFGKADLGAFVVATGPGSFTGLRVGLAGIKGLAEILERPVVAVSLLEVVARSAKTPGQVRAALDAGRNEAYVGEYDVGPLWAECIQEQLIRLVDLGPGPIVVTPDKNVAEALRGRGVPVQEIPRPQSDALVQLGWEKLAAGQTVSISELDAIYMRRWDGELFARSG